jgi:hypothetical protein
MKLHFCFRGKNFWRNLDIFGETKIRFLNMEFKKIVIDKKLNIEVNKNNYHNEINTLMNLRFGLMQLYNSVRPMELKLIKENNGNEFHFIGSHPTIPIEFHHMLPCLFHWFGTSVCNYTRLVGYIVSNEQGLINKDMEFDNKNKRQIKESCDSYVKSVEEIKEILRWRNKIGAHFALTDPRPEDNIATLEASIIYPIGFAGNRYKTSNFLFSRIEENNCIDSEIPQWSLTEAFEILRDRFWPEVTFK